MNIHFSRWLAIIGGILIPLLETIRRWSTWRESPASLFDDYILGAFLLFGAWQVGKDIRSGQRFLAGPGHLRVGLVTSVSSVSSMLFVEASQIRRLLPPSGFY